MISQEEKILGASWANELQGIFSTPPMQELRDFLAEEKAKGAVIYPHASQVFRAFQLTPYDAVKVVFVGQDPYHGAGQAEGLCFSVPLNMPIPPSLRNIFLELKSHLKKEIPKQGSLVRWAEQGCFLINARLTVRANEALSHNHKGWIYFTEQVFQALDRKKTPILFVLLGTQAQKMKFFINNPIHHIFEAPHPSPLSAHRGFLGSGLFQHIDAFTEAHYQNKIEWVKID